MPERQAPAWHGFPRRNCQAGAWRSKFAKLVFGVPSAKLGLGVPIIYSYQPYLTREQIMHHALLDVAGFSQLGFQSGDFGIHVGEDGGDGGLF